MERDMNQMPDKPLIDDRYRLGIDAMDRQHTRWIQLIEHFRDICAGHLTDQRGLDAAAKALAELLQYTKTHFASEELLLTTHHYPDLESHKKKHRDIEATVARFLDEVRTHKSNNTPLKLNLFITVWLLEHILKDDGDYARFILAKAGAGLNQA
jgi:hemerythrin